MLWCGAALCKVSWALSPETYGQYLSRIWRTELGTDRRGNFMRGICTALLLCGIFLPGKFVFAQQKRQHQPEVQFERLQLNTEYYCDGVAVGDIDADGHSDIVAGPYWYAGPVFEEKFSFYPPVALLRKLHLRPVPKLVRFLGLRIPTIIGDSIQSPIHIQVANSLAMVELG